MSGLGAVTQFGVVEYFEWLKRAEDWTERSWELVQMVNYASSPDEAEELRKESGEYKSYSDVAYGVADQWFEFLMSRGISKEFLRSLES